MKELEKENEILTEKLSKIKLLCEKTALEIDNIDKDISSILSEYYLYNVPKDEFSLKETFKLYQELKEIDLILNLHYFKAFKELGSD